MGEIYPEQPTGRGKPAWLRFEVLLEASDALAGQECPPYRDGMLEEMAVVRGWRYYGGTQSDVGFEAQRKTVEMPEVEDPMDRYRSIDEYQVSYCERGTLPHLPEEAIAAADEQRIAIAHSTEEITFRYKFDLVYGDHQGIGWGERRTYHIQELSDGPWRPPKRVNVQLDQGCAERHWLQALDENMHMLGTMEGNEQDATDYTQEPTLKRVWQGLMIVKALERKGQPLMWKNARPEV